MNAAAPFYALTPDVVLGAIESLGLRCDGRLLQLNSYENRVYQVGLEDSAPVVAKFYRPGRWDDAQILEEHTFALELHDRELPVVAPMRIGARTLHHRGAFRVALFPRRGGRAPELEVERVLEWIGRFLGRLHAVGAAAPFRNRPALDAESFGREPREYLLAGGFIPDDLREPYRAVTGLALAAAERCYAEAGGVRLIRLHGDCHAGNILWSDDGPHFVDLDDARTGPAVQDLWMLLSGDAASRSRQLGAVLRGYCRFHEFDVRELRLVEALRTLRLMHYAAWIAQRWEDPAFPAAFTWFGTQRYWQEHVLQLREQIPAMEEPALAPA